MLTVTEERLLKYIENRARENIRGKNFYKMTDVLEQAFWVSEEKAYEVLKNIISRKNIGNSKDAIVNEYIDMLKKGYGSIQEQVEIFGGDKVNTVLYTAKKRLKNFEGGTFFDILRNVYKVQEEEIIPLTEKFLKFLNAQLFHYRLEEDTFHRFLQSDLEELDKQYDRFMNL